MQNFKIYGKATILLLTAAISIAAILVTTGLSHAIQTGVVQSVSEDGKVTNTYYGDYADGWNLSIDLGLDDSAWKLKVEKRTQFHELLQFFHPDETVDNWTEFVTVEKLVGPIVPTVTLDGISKALGSRAKVVQIYHPDQMAYSGSSDNGSRFDMARVFITKDAVFTLTYATRNVSDDADKIKWAETFKRAKVLFAQP